MERLEFKKMRAIDYIQEVHHDPASSLEEVREALTYIIGEAETLLALIEDDIARKEKLGKETGMDPSPVY